MNTTIQKNNVSHNLNTPSKQQTNYHTPKLILKGEKKKTSKDLSVENIDREIFTSLNDKINGEAQFCLSLVDTLKKISPRKNLLAKSKNSVIVGKSTYG